MKRLFGVLVVLIIGINCFGQEDNFVLTNVSFEGFEQYEKYKWYNFYTKEYIDSSWYYNTIEIIVNEYDKYSKECYNDSSLDYYYEFCDVECYKFLCDKNENFWSIMPCKGIWTHKQPTFEGFINRLKTKMEEYPWE